MPTIYDKFVDLIGTGSLPPIDTFGTTTGSGNYSAVGMDVYTLPGVLFRDNRIGIFKKGPVSLFTSSSRDYWWGAKITDANTPSIELYSAGIAGTTLRYTTPTMSVMPDDIDFNITSTGDFIFAATIRSGSIYPHLYILSSSNSNTSSWVNWTPLVAEPTKSIFTPRITYAGGECILSYVDNLNHSTQYNGAVANADLFAPRIVTHFLTSNAQFLYHHPTVNNALPDDIGTIATSSIGDGVTNYFEGSITGTMIGHMTGTLNGMTGVFDIHEPTRLYGKFNGIIESAKIAGNITGSLSSSAGNFYGSINGDANALYSNAIISGTVTGSVYPTHDMRVRPVVFIADIVPTISNRLQLTYGSYDPITQHITYHRLLSAMNVTSTNSTFPIGGGVPVNMEVFYPRDTFPDPDTDLRGQLIQSGANPGENGEVDITGKYLAVDKISSVRWMIINRYTPLVVPYTITYNSANTNYLQRPADNIIDITKTLGGAGTSYPNWLGAPNPNPTLTPYTFAAGDATINGCIFPSSSWSDISYNGYHIALDNITQASMIGSRTDYAGIPAIVSESLGTDYGVNQPTVKLYIGSKLKPILSDEFISSSFTCSMSASQYQGVPTNSYQFVITGSSLLNLFLPYFTYSTSMAARAQFDPIWYPNITYHMEMKSLLTGRIFTSSFTLLSSLLAAIP